MIQRRGSSWRARYEGPDGRERSKSFARKADAERWLAQQRTLIAQDDWTDPALGRISFGEYVLAWLDARTDLKPRTRHQHQSLLVLHILPTWGTVPLGKVTRRSRTSPVRSRSRRSWPASWRWPWTGERPTTSCSPCPAGATCGCPTGGRRPSCPPAPGPGSGSAIPDSRPAAHCRVPTSFPGRLPAEDGAGHPGARSITTTLDLYGHLYPGDMDRYSDRLGDAAEAADPAKIRPDEPDDDAGTEGSAR
jgi:hypothetical protein